MINMTPEQAMASLDLVGSDAVADLLRSKGIKGLKGVTRKCPLARYLQIETGNPFVVVSVSDAAFHSSADSLRPLYLGLPPAAKDFEAHFDCTDRYDDLVGGMA